MSEKSEGDGARIQTGSAVDSLTAPSVEQRVPHSPGPWTVDEGLSNRDECAHGAFGCIMSATGHYVVSVWADNSELKLAAAANAHLIAAAPDMYEVLREAVDAYSAQSVEPGQLPVSDETARRVMRARLVLLKAEGR